MINVLSTPLLDSWTQHESGIRRVVEAYKKYLPQFGVELVGPSDRADLLAVHAGTSKNADVAHCHGLYWTADYKAPNWEWRGNEHVINSVRQAKIVTVPSRWVAETFERDMRFSPVVIGHGIDWEEWQNHNDDNGYILWNKNRGGEDVCDPYPVTRLARTFRNELFLTTFSRGDITSNVKVTGIIKHNKMKTAIQECSVYLATTKETFGIGILEAMASGKPVLGFNHGGITEMVKHGINGYLADPYDYTDLEEGLRYCLANKKILGENGREMCRSFTWEKQVEKVAEVYRTALEIAAQPPLVDVVIPVYNKEPQQLKRAINGAASQDSHLGNIIVVDDGSTMDDAEKLYREVVDEFPGAEYYRKDNGGVATARNYGISQGKSKYVVCLDSDDTLKPEFLRACVPPLEEDESLGITFTGLWFIKPDGGTGLSPWPDGYEYDKFFKRQNQVPTAAVFRRKMWERLGGYKQRYAPQGAGSEDAEFWFRAGAYGWRGEKVTDAGLFVYSWLSGAVSGNPDYKEVDWQAWHPWAKDMIHPFASVANTSSKRSHAVRQYDEPVISVIIPVGPGHKDDLENALDSLEAQGMRRWEAIVVDDSGGDVKGKCNTAYPYVKWHETGRIGAGSGAARNIGVNNSRGGLILYLDADDFLFPDALREMYSAWEDHGYAVYTGYYGRAIINDVSELSDKVRSNIVREEGEEKVIEYIPNEYDCSRALRAPENPPYVWNTVTTLFPKAWHYEIGGFDETMPSWEDVLYWYKMAWSGKCFHRVDEPLMMYKFYSGSRRDKGIELGKQLIDYINLEKSKIDLTRIRAMGCKCNKGQNPPSPPPAQMEAVGLEGVVKNMNDDSDLILVQYTSPNKGQHSVVGAKTKTNYSYRRGGDVFLIHHEDYSLQPHMFVIVDNANHPGRPVEKVKKVELQEPVPIQEDKEDSLISEDEFDLQILPGVTPKIAQRMKMTGLSTPNVILQHGEDSLVAVKGIGGTKAAMIYDYVVQNYGDA
jgi:glycosyltransferase involved in cell wall biosynthesis